MPLIDHPTVMDIIRWGLLAADLWVLVSYVIARRHGRAQDAQQMWYLFLILLAAYVVAKMLPLN